MVGIPLKLGATKADLDGLIGIHPTNAEVGFVCFALRSVFLTISISHFHQIFTTLTVTKRSGLDPTQKGCCG